MRLLLLFLGTIQRKREASEIVMKDGAIIISIEILS